MTGAKAALSRSSYALFDHHRECFVCQSVRRAVCHVTTCPVATSDVSIIRQTAVHRPNGVWIDLKRRT